MNYEAFCWWLQGFMEIQNPEELTKEQVVEIKNHLALVFHKVTPDIGVGLKDAVDTGDWLEKVYTGDNAPSYGSWRQIRLCDLGKVDLSIFKTMNYASC